MKKLSVCLLSIFILLSLSCEIGLGASVDTEAPTLEIANPPSDAIIRDSFAVSGSWKDDGSISSVTMEMVRLDNNKRVSFEGTFADPPERGADGSWQVVINPKETGLLDGTYEALVAISDNGGHTTTMARSFTIDNTPPVMILQKPSTVVSSSGNTTLFDTFGQNFSIVGQASDDNLVDKIEVSVYSDPSCVESSFIKKITLGNVPPTIDLNVATFQEGINNDYSDIYGYNTIGYGNVQRYFKLEVYDTAKKYNLDGTLEDVGNKRDTYYLYKEISDLISEYKATGLYKILSGTKSANSVEITSRLESDKRAIGKFQLNPDNSPTFVVSARTPLPAANEDGSIPSLNDAAYQLTSGNSFIEIQVDPGLDNSPIVENTLGIYLKKCNEYGIPYTDAEKIWLIKPVVAASDEFADDIDSDGHSGENCELTVSGDSYKLKTTKVISKLNYNPLEIGDCYRIYVTGKDMNEMEIVPYNNSVYAFKLSSSGNSIELSPTISPVYVTTNPASNGADSTEKNSFTVTLKYQGGNSPYTYWEDDTQISPDTVNEIDNVFVAEIHKGLSDIVSYKTDNKSSLGYKVKGGAESVSIVKNVQFVIDDDKPVIYGTTPEAQIKVENENYSSTRFYGKENLKITGEWTEPNLEAVYYYVDYPDRGETVPTNLAIIHDGEASKISDARDGSGNIIANRKSFEFKADQFKDNAIDSEGHSVRNTLYIQAMDKSGNLSNRLSYTINVDTSEPNIGSSFYYQLGTDDTAVESNGQIYVNGTKDLIVYGKAYDLQSGLSSTNPLVFTIGDSTDSVNLNSLQFASEEPAEGANMTSLNYVTSPSNMQAVKYWKATFAKELINAANKCGTLRVKATNGTTPGKSSQNTTVFNITFDNQKPVPSITNFTSSNTNKKPYKKGNDYYLNNIDDGDASTTDAAPTFTLSGIAIDSYGLKDVSLKVGADTITRTSTSLTEWVFADFDLSTYTTSANAVLSVTDLAGNTETLQFTIIFDTTGPKAMHWADAKHKDIYFRIGDSDNDCTKDANGNITGWETEDTPNSTNNPKNQDVGKKYSYGSWGNDSTIEIRGYFKEAENESGLKTIHYAIFDSDPVTTNITREGESDPVSLVDAFIDGSLKKSESTHISALGSFAPYETAVTKRVPYNKNENTTDNKAAKDVITNFRTKLSGFDSESNYLVLVAEDNAGNRAADTLVVTEGTAANGTNNETAINNGTSEWNSEEHDTSIAYYNINKDTTAPTVSGSITAGSFTNGTGNIVVSGKAEDADSGLKEVYVSINENGVEINQKATLSADPNDPDNPKKKSWTTSISANQFTSGTYTVYVKATDNAGVGNSKEISVGSITVDQEPPTAEINDITNLNVERADDDTTVYVNGTITLSGTANDNQKLASLLVEYKKHTDPDTAANWTPITNAPSNSTLANWKRILDTTALDDETEYDIRVSATDVAGNSTDNSAGSTTLAARTKTIKVSQDSDRPVITVTSPTSIEDLATGSVKWQNRTIGGTVTDDDSVTYIGYYRGDNISYADADYTTITINNGIWRVTLPDDGTDKVFFKVTAGGKDYFANMATTFTTATIYDETNSRGTYKLTDGSHRFGYRLTGDTTTANALALIIDTVAPDVETAEFSTDNGVTWNSGIGAQTFGGSRKNKFKIRQTGWDKNGVKSMTVKITETINGTENETPKFNETYDLTSNPAEEARPNGKIYYRFTSGEIDVTGWESSSKSNTASVEYRIEIVMSDGINSSSTKLDLTVDNTPPVISFTSPDSNATHSGEISVNGSSDELGSFYYTVSTYGDDAHKPSLAAGQTLTGWTGYQMSEDGTKTAASGPITNATVPVYRLIPTTTLSWGVHFDGNTSDTQRAHADLLKNFVHSLGITDNLNTFTDLVNFYIWIKAEDTVGNSKEYSHLVCIDPQGDRPSVSILAPETPGASLGGTIKLYGSAEDSNGTVESVWVQLLSAKNGGTAAGYGPVAVTNSNVTSFVPTTKDLDFWKSNGFTVAKMKPEADGTHTEWTGTTESPGSLSGSDTAADYGIKAVFTGTTSWNLKINKNQEFNSTSTNDMAMRVYACDNDKNLSYPVTRYFVIDKGAPVISEVMLKQYAASDTSFEHPLASQEVRSGMYVKGKWYLEFTATDDNGLTSVVFKDESGAETAIPPADITEESDKVWKVRYALATDQGVGVFKQTIVAEDGNNSGTYEIEINYDNEAPKLLKNSSTDFNIEAAVRQSNGFYKLYSKVNDSTASQTGTPSGVKAVGFYFMRRKSASEGLIYDPMQRRADPVSTNNLTYADGLYWFNGAVSINSEGVITLGSGLSEKSAYIHTGTYIRLDGVMYKIISVSGNNVTIEESVDTSLTSAQIALAQFVDNRKAEYEASSTKNATTGYYSSIKNDDGDSMIEELGGTNAVSSWQASIVSRNIPDGPIEIHYTAYDASLNYAVGVVGNKDQAAYESYSTPEVNEIKDKTQITDGQYASYVYTYNSESPAYISNNAPRLAGVTVKIDYIGTGNYETATPTTYYFNESPVLINGNAVKKPITVTDNFEIYDEAKDEDGNLIGYKGVNTIKGKTWIIPEMVGGNKKLWYSYNIYDSNTDGSKNTSVIKKAGGDDALYFADGRDDYDEYEEKAAGQTYVVSHNTSKLGAGGVRPESYIEHDPSIFTDTGDTTSISRPFWFDYVIYDSTEAEPDGASAAISALENNQKARISIAMAVDVNDIIAPSVVINDLYWKNAADNSIYWEGGKSKGHVELISDIGTTALGTTYGTDDDKVSGIVKFSGYAYDNKCLKELKWAIVSNLADGSYTSPTYLFNNGMQNGATFDINSGTWACDATLESDYYTFVVSTESSDGAYHDKNGHRVKWTLIVDTSHITGVVAENVRVIVQAKDNATSPKLSEISNDVTADSRSTYKVDVVPYITGIDTGLSKSLKSSIHNAYSRTALGHYIARSTEILAVKGYNLGNSTVISKYGETNLSFDSNGNVKLPVSSIGTSSQIVLTVNNLPTVNNLNDNNACGSYRTANTEITESSSYDLKSNYAYNRMPNKNSNNLLTDDIFVDIWQFDEDAAKPMSGELREPSMKINPVTGKVGLAFVSGPGDFAMAGGSSVNTKADAAANVDPTKDIYSYNLWQNNYATYNNISFTYDSLGYAHATATGLDTNPGSSSLHAGRFTYFYNRWGRSEANTTANYNGINAVRLESLAIPNWYKSDTDWALAMTTNTQAAVPYWTKITKNFDASYAGNQNGQIPTATSYKLPIKGVVQEKPALTETRFYSPSIAATVHGSGNSATTAVYLAYFDSIQGQIRFRYSQEVPKTWVKGETWKNPSNNKSETLSTTFEKWSVDSNNNVTVNEDYNEEYLTGAEIALDANGKLSGLGTFQGNTHHALNDKDDFVDNLGYFYKSKDYEAYMEANTDHFSLIAGVDYQLNTDGQKDEANFIVEDIEDKQVDVEQVDSDGKAINESVVRYRKTKIENDAIVIDGSDYFNVKYVAGVRHLYKNNKDKAYEVSIQEDNDIKLIYRFNGTLNGTETYQVADPATDEKVAALKDYGYPVFVRIKDSNGKPVDSGACEYLIPTAATIKVPVHQKQKYPSGYNTGYTAYKYVAIDAKAGNEADQDTVVAVWFDGTNCRYAYNTNPSSGLDNGSAGGWQGNKVIFSEGGEHCTVKFDPNGGVHIAAYVDGSLKYAYLSSYDAAYSEATDSVSVDSFTITGERINLDVGLEKVGNTENYVVVPYITYFNGTARKPTMAKLVIPENGEMNYKAQGTVDDIFTGNWEISLIPSPSVLTTNYYDKMNIGLWKWEGKVVNSNDSHFGTVVTAKTSADNTSTGDNGNIYGNGTANPILGYAVESTSGTYLETAQMK